MRRAWFDDGMSEPQRAEATRTIPASPSVVFAIISDPRGHVAIDASGSLLGAPDPRPATAVGEVFVIDMDREALGDRPMGRYQSECRVTRIEEDRLFEWNVRLVGDERPPIGHVYGYELTDNGDGTTTVTSYCDWTAVPDKYKVPGVWPIVPQTALRATLGILERTIVRKVPLELFG